MPDPSRAFLLTLAIIAADQATKALWADPDYLNRGLAFGLGDLPYPVELGLAAAVVAVALVVVRPRSWVAAGLLAGAAAGNMIDQLVFGGVRDFLPLGSYTYNLADFAFPAALLALVAWAFLDYREGVNAP